MRADSWLKYALEAGDFWPRVSKRPLWHVSARAPVHFRTYAHPNQPTIHLINRCLHSMMNTLAVIRGLDIDRASDSGALFWGWWHVAFADVWVQEGMAGATASLLKWPRLRRQQHPWWRHQRRRRWRLRRWRPLPLMRVILFSFKNSYHETTANRTDPVDCRCSWPIQVGLLVLATSNASLSGGCW